MDDVENMVQLDKQARKEPLECRELRERKDFVELQELLDQEALQVLLEDRV